MWTPDRRMMWHGLVIGMQEHRFKSMRMALYRTNGNWLFTAVGAALGTAPDCGIGPSYSSGGAVR